MKPKRIQNLLFLTPAILLTITPAFAVDYYWDANAATAGTGGTGNWNLGSALWRDGSAAGALGTWVNGNSAMLGGTYGTLTIPASTAIQANQINVVAGTTGTSPFTVSVAGSGATLGTLTFTGANKSINVPTSLALRINPQVAQTTGVGETNLLTVQGGGTLTMGTSNRSYSGNIKVTGANTLLVFAGTNGLDNGTNSLGLTVDSGAIARLGGTSNFRNTSLVLTNGTFQITNSTNGLVLQNGSSITVNGTAKSSIIGSAGAGNTAKLFANGAVRTITVNSTGDPSGYDLEVSASSGLMALQSNTFQKNGAGVMRLMENSYVSFNANLTYDYTKTSLIVNQGTFQNENRVYSMTQVNSGATAKTGATTGSYDAVTVNGTGVFELSRATGSFNDSLVFGTGENSLTLNNGGILKFVGVNTDVSSSLNALSGTGGTIDTNTQDVTFATALTGSGGLAKAGSGKLTLSAANTYTGTTTVTGGTLALGASSSLASTQFDVQNTGTLDVSALAGGLVLNTPGSVFSGTGSSSVIGNLTLGAGSEIRPGGVALDGTIAITGNLTSSGTYVADLDSLANDLITVSGNANLTGATINVIPTPPPAPALPLQSYTILSYGTLTGTPVLDPLFASSRLNPTLDLGPKVSAGNVTVTIAGALADLIWTGEASNLWNNNSAVNWDNGGADDVFKPLDSVEFNDSAVGNFTIDIPAEVNQSGMVFENDTNTYTFAGNGFISGNGGLIMNGSGTVIISTNNTFTGDIDNTNSLGTLQFGSGGITGSPGPGDILNSGRLVFNRSNDLTIANIISGSGGLEQSGSGKLTLTSVNTYAGSTIISAGTLSISAINRLGTSPAAATPGHLGINGTLETTAVMTINPNRGITLGPVDATGNGTIAVNTALDTDIVTYNGIITNNGLTGVGGLVKTGIGRLNLGGINTYSGPTTIEAGTLACTTPEALGSASAGTSVSSGAWLYLITGAQTSPFAEPLSLTGNGNGSGALRAGGGVRHTLAGPITLSGATTLFNDATSAMDFTNTITGTNTDLTIVAATALTTTFGGSLSLGTGGFNKQGTATVILESNNSYGATNITAGTLQVGNGGAAGSLGSGNVTNDSALAINRSNALSIPNDISGSGSVTQAGTGITTLSGTNSYLGATNVNTGTLILNGTHAGGGDYNIAAPATFSGTGTTASTVSLTGTVAPGTSIAILSTGPLVLNDTSTLAMEINTSTVSADKIVVTGDVTRPGAAANLVLTDLGSNVALPGGTKLTLVDYSGTWDTSKVLTYNGNPVANDTTITLGANTFTVKYDDDTALTLTTVVSGTPFDAWINGFVVQLPNAADRLADADPDGDGRNNLMEFALDGDPSSSSNPGKMQLRTDDSGDAGTDRDLNLTLAVRNGAVLGAGPNNSVTLTVDGIVYTIEGSTTLAMPFDGAISESSPASALVPAPNTGWTARTFRLDSSEGLAGKGFMRVKVSP